MRYLRYGVIDIRQEIAEYEREHRPWPRSGSVSKPFAPESCWPLFRHPSIVQRLRDDLREEENYKHHRFGLIYEEGK